MKKRLLDLGRIVYAVNTSISPSHYLAFRLYDEYGVEYEVLAPSDEPVWRWSGTIHQVRRIHTKEIGKI